MADHIFTKSELIRKFDDILDKKLAEVDTKDLFKHILEKKFKLQKGIAGAVIEQCVLNYPADTKQEADLVVTDNDGSRVNTELKVTGMRISKENGKKRFTAKEPMSITAVGVYDLDQQSFSTSHFLNKLEHMLIVYYLYDSNKVVKPYDYKDFPIKGYEFHEFCENDMQILANDWKHVHSLMCEIVKNNPGIRDDKWEKRVKQEYIEKHGRLRSVLSYIDLAPKFPPRFRLKKPTVSAIISKHFGYDLEQLPGRYTSISDIDFKLQELTEKYKGKTIGELADCFGVPRIGKTEKESKSIAEQIVIKMFGGNSKKLNSIEIFQRFGLTGKSIVVTPSGGKTEDMKLFHIHFDDIMQKSITDEEGNIRTFTFEDSEIYNYFMDNELLCIIFEEPQKEYGKNDATGKRVEVKHPLVMNRFIGFKRLIFSNEFIERHVKPLWEDTRSKILNGTLVDVKQINNDGGIKKLKNGEESSAPNFMKSSQNEVFIRGGGGDSSLANKTECVNGIKMLPQFVWIKGSTIIDELGEIRWNTPKVMTPLLKHD